MSAGIPIPPGITASRESRSASRDARKPPTHRFGGAVTEAWESPVLRPVSTLQWVAYVLGWNNMNEDARCRSEGNAPSWAIGQWSAAREDTLSHNKSLATAPGQIRKM